ncbi:MAG: choice-of-anchor Q domain-containing protein, partial [Chloroflexota bacterium]
MFKNSKFWIGLLLLGLIGFWGTQKPADAAGLEFDVDSLLDSIDASPGDGECKDENGFCTLRAALHELSQSANLGSDTINLPAGYFILTLDGMAEDNGLTGDLDIFDDVIIKGAGADQTFIQAAERSGEGIDRVFHVQSSVMTLENLTVRYGLAKDGVTDSGGGIFNNGGNVFLNNSAVIFNTAELTGGGIYNLDGQVDISQSLIANNIAAEASAMVNKGETTSASIDIVDSTISSNQAGTSGVAFDNVQSGVNAGAIINMDFVTLASNLGGIGGFRSNTTDGLSMVNSIITNNPGSQCVFSSGTVEGSNLFVDDASCDGLTPNAVTNFDVNLTDNGGPTPTHALLEGSNALGSAFSSDCIGFLDQRGRNRPEICDAGAYEFHSAYNLTIVNGTTLNNVRQDGQNFYAYDIGATLGVDLIRAELLNGDVKVFTGDGLGGQDGDITWQSTGFLEANTDLDFDGVGTRKFSLEAADDIDFFGAILDSTSGGDSLDIDFNANRADRGGIIVITGDGFGEGIINTGGGNFYAVGNATNDPGGDERVGIQLNTAAVDVGSGEIRLRATGKNPVLDRSINLVGSTTMSGSGLVKLQPAKVTDVFRIADVELLALQDGFQKIFVGRPQGQALVTIENLVSSFGMTISDPIQFLAPISGGEIWLADVPFSLSDNAEFLADAYNNVTAGDITSSGQFVELTSSRGNVTVQSISTVNGQGSGGDVELIAPNGNVAITGEISDSSNSINTSGSSLGGTITIVHGGGDSGTAFIVGDSSVNGSSSDLTTGNATIAATQSYTGNYTESGPADIEIITGTPLQLGP